MKRSKVWMLEMARERRSRVAGMVDDRRALAASRLRKMKGERIQNALRVREHVGEKREIVSSLMEGHGRLWKSGSCGRPQRANAELHAICTPSSPRTPQKH